MNGIKNALTGIIAMLAAMLASITERSPGRRLSPGVKTLALAGIVLLVAAGSASAQNVSTRSGWWDDASIWNPVGVPGPGDDVIIQQGHNVWLHDGQDRAVSVNVDTLVVNGTLSSAVSERVGRGFPVVVSARDVANRGTIRGLNGWYSSGSIVYLEGGGQFTNTGTIIAGDADVHSGGVPLGGGDVYIHGYGDVTNLGTIQAGLRSGSISIVGGDIVNGDNQNVALIQAGAGGLVPGVAAYTGGLALVCGDSVAIGPDSEVRAGNGDGVANGGLAAVMGAGLTLNTTILRLGAGSLIRGGDGCNPGPAWAFAWNKDIQGDVVAGRLLCQQGTPARAVIDPPQGNISGEANVTGCGVDLAAGNLLTIGPLNNAEAIHADKDMVITIAPGGTLNMSALTPGTYWLSAIENVTIKADYIELYPGAQLSDIISAPEITTESGSRFAQLAMSPDGDIVLAPGQSVNLSVFTANAGNMYDQVEWNVTGMEDWWGEGPINRYDTLDPMEGMNETIHIEIPEDATPGSNSTLYLHASSSSGEVADSEFKVTVHPAGPQLPCLGDCCNDSGCTDPYASDMNCSACIAMDKYWKPYKNSDCFNDTTPSDMCLDWCPECCDGIDNLDEDLDIDYPLDGQCTCGLDPTEENPALPIPELLSVVMVAIGLLMLVGLVRFRRKE